MDALPVEGSGELFGLVQKMVGARHLLVEVDDNLEMNIRIPGRMKNSQMVRPGDLVVIKPWEFQQGRGDLKSRFSKTESGAIQRAGLLPLPFHRFELY